MCPSVFNRLFSKKKRKTNYTNFSLILEKNKKYKMEDGKIYACMYSVTNEIFIINNYFKCFMQNYYILLKQYISFGSMLNCISNKFQ